PLIESGTHVQAHRFAGYWEDVGTLRSYYQASMDLLRTEPSLLLDDPSWPILTRDEERPPVHVLPGAELEGSLVANGCRVAGRVRAGAVLGVGAGAADFHDAQISAGERVRDRLETAAP